MKKTLISLFLILLAVIAFGIWAKWDDIIFYQKFAREEGFTTKVDLGRIVSVVEKQFLSPPPLKTSSKVENNKVQDAGGFTKQAIIQETNIQRQKNGLPALTENKNLDAAALAKANDMFSNQYFEHNSPAGVDPGKLVQNYGYQYITAGENLIMGSYFASSKEIVQEWMDSPGHRANILNSKYTEMGAAIIKGKYKGETVWMGVQEFGRPLASCREPSMALKNQITESKIILDSLFSEINQFKNQDLNSNNLVDQYNSFVEQYRALAENVKKMVEDYNRQVNSFNNCISSQ